MSRLATALLLALLPNLVAAQTFTDASGQINNSSTLFPLGAAIVDLNRDGRADIYRTGSWYVNEGTSGFTDRRVSMGIEADNEWGAVFGDIDNDGRVDAYIILPNTGAILYRQTANGQYDAVPNDGGIDVDDTFVQGSLWFDYDLDGHLDLFVADDLHSTSAVPKSRRRNV